MHIPDVFVLKPIFFEGERVAFAATICHQTDMGGRVAGSNASDSTEIYQEGLRIPPVKMYDQGEPNETLFRLFEKNVRVPVRCSATSARSSPPVTSPRRRSCALLHRHGAKQVAGVHGGGARPHRAAHPRDPPRAARRRVVVRGLDRRRRRRLRQADPALRDVQEARRPARGGLDRHVAAAEGRHHQHALVHEGRDLHRAEVGAVVRRAVQRGLLSRHRRDRAAGHDRQRRARPRRPRRAGSPASA